jgi:hypothetical protein
MGGRSSGFDLLLQPAVFMDILSALIAIFLGAVKAINTPAIGKIMLI